MKPSIVLAFGITAILLLWLARETFDQRLSVPPSRPTDTPTPMEVHTQRCRAKYGPAYKRVSPSTIFFDNRRKKCVRRISGGLSILGPF